MLLAGNLNALNFVQHIVRGLGSCSYYKIYISINNCIAALSIGSAVRIASLHLETWFVEGLARNSARKRLNARILCSEMRLIEEL